MNNVLCGTVFSMLALVGCSTAEQANARQANDLATVEAVSNDSAVVNEAMLAFYDNSVWNGKNDWDTGEYVVVRPIWATEKRLEFESLLDDSIEYYSKSKEIFQKLTEMKASISREQPRFDPGPVTAFKDMDLDERIVPGEVKREFGTRVNEYAIENRLGVQGTVRATGRLDPPCYSQDGRYACVKMTTLPWGMHSADAFFFLENTREGWTVVCVTLWIYP